MKILDDRHPLLLRPCKIWQKDFENWAQERGAYFPNKWAPEYTPLLSSHDPGEKALDGGLLVADVGRGAFIYTSYFWHHQLRTGVSRRVQNAREYAELLADETRMSEATESAQFYCDRVAWPGRAVA